MSELKIERAYRVIGSHDSDWGGPCLPDFTIGYYWNRDAALEKAKGAGSWGTDGEIEEVEVLKANGNIFVLSGPIQIFDDVDDEEKQAALAKLTPRQRRLLGLE